jgi:AcrR family transcriptional regulator
LLSPSIDSLVIETFLPPLESFDEGFFRFGVRIMPADVLVALEPRKTPVQARAAVTVEAIFEASIQVLLTHGAERLTTSRVAQRAGVSVGTLYQYFPNKHSLLFAVFEDHLNKVAVAVESACEQAYHKPLTDMIRQLVEAYVTVKMDRADISVALYKVAPAIGGAALVERVGRRLRKGIEAMLQTAPDVELPPDKFAIEMMLAAMSGTMRSALEAGASPATFRKKREHLVVLCQSYMTAVTAQRI